MDVEKIQKINELALKLQQQGNLSTEEAAKQAEIMLSKTDKLEINEISSQKLEEREKEPRSNITWQEAMEKNTKFIVKEFKDIQREIINLKAEVENLNHKIKNLKNTPPPRPVPPPEIQSELPKEEKPPEKKEKHPKQGDCKPEDFSVEKMFYCGNK